MCIRDRYNIIYIIKSVITTYMSNTSTFKDFYQVPDVTFDISKLRNDLEKILKKSKYQTLGITNFHAIPMNKVPGDNSSVEGDYV